MIPTTKSFLLGLNQAMRWSPARPQEDEEGGGEEGDDDDDEDEEDEEVEGEG